MPQPRLARPSGPRPGTGIVHLGLGAFFRAHGAIYIAEAMALRGGDWGVLGISLQSPVTRDALQPQGWDYTAVEQGPDGETAQVISILNGVLVAREDPQAVLDAMADPGVRIVSLTVTEKGYCHAPSTGELDFDHPDIVHDLDHPLPRSAPGFLVRALALRRRAGEKPFTVMSCDNLPGNGRLVRKVVLSLARAVDPGLADWIETRGAFPSTMVDRIVPAIKPEDLARLAEMTGRLDVAPVLHEPFRQWVIEDSFAGGRPDFSTVGVQMVRDVAPHEHMKLRMLNGSHSSLAYLGYLAGHETIADTVADPVFADFVRQLWAREIIPALKPPPGESLSSYAEALLARYRNPTIRHRTWQIAMDGSQKLPQRLLGTLRDNAAAGRASPGLTLAVAGWMVYVGGVDEQGRPIEVRDPLAARLRALSDGAATPAAKVAALLTVAEIFPAGQAASLTPGVTSAYRALRELGAREAVRKIAQWR